MAHLQQITILKTQKYKETFIFFLTDHIGNDNKYSFYFNMLFYVVIACHLPHISAELLNVSVILMVVVVVVVVVVSVILMVVMMHGGGDLGVACN